MNQLRNAAVLTIVMLLAVSSVNAQDVLRLPEGAKPGECYARVLTAPKFETRTERVLKSEASTEIEVVPATFGTETQRVLVKEGGEVLQIVGTDGRPLTGADKPQVRTLPNGTIEIIPQAFETITERVLVRPEYSTIEVVSPPMYETVTEKVMIRPARTEWQPSAGRIYGNAVEDASGKLVTQEDAKTGDLMCLVEIPAEYRTITKRVLKAPAKTATKTVPAEYRTVTKRVPKNVMTKTVTTEPEYQTITKEVVKTPARERTIERPAEYDTITKRVQTQEGEVVWMSVLCEANVTAQKVREIQQALQRRGFNPGTVDGQLGAGTMTAIDAFQRKEGLATGELTMNTLKALGISL